MTAKTKGRPKGAKNLNPPQAEVHASRCIKCGSTNREAYSSPRTVNHSGLHYQTGEPFTSIEIRRTRCKDCGQVRDDRIYVYDPIPGK